MRDTVRRRLSLFDWLVPIALIGSLGFSYVIYESRPAVYTSHVLMGLTMVTIVLTFRSWFVPPSFALAAFWILAASLIGFGNTRFVLEFIKLLFVVSSYGLFLQAFISHKPKIRLIALSFVVGMVVSTITPTDVYDITVLSRSPDIQRSIETYNTYGFTVATSLLLCAYLFLTSTRYLSRLLAMSTGTYLSVVLVTTFSRGAFLSLIGALAVGVVLVSRRRPEAENRGRQAASRDAKGRVTHSGIKRCTQLFIYAVAFVLIVGGLLDRLTDNYDLNTQTVTNPFWLLISRFEDTTGSGRAVLWPLLINDLLASPIHLLIGKGVGSIDSEIVKTPLLPDFNSSHSLYVDALHQFGLLGLSALLWYVYRTYRGLLRTPQSFERTLMVALLTQLVIGSAFDSYYATSQFAWTFGFWFAMFWASIILNAHATAVTSVPLSSPRRLMRDYARS